MMTVALGARYEKVAAQHSWYASLIIRSIFRRSSYLQASLSMLQVILEELWIELNPHSRQK